MCYIEHLYQQAITDVRQQAAEAMVRLHALADKAHDDACTLATEKLRAERLCVEWRLEYDPPPTIEELQAAWDQMSFEDQMDYWNAFIEACISGIQDPSDWRFYRLLMHYHLQNYVGD